MFDVGFFELVLIFVIALLILGPERLPKVVRAVGNWTGRAKAMLSNFQYELERESTNEDMRRKFSNYLEELGIDEEDLAKGNNPGETTTDPAADNTIAPPASPESDAASAATSKSNTKANNQGNNESS